MSKEGITSTVLVTGLKEAVAKDEEGYDISAGLFGPHTLAWFREVTDEICDLSTQNARLKTIISEREAKIDTLYKIAFPEVYEEGHKTGRNWKAPYVPGGPHEDQAPWLSGFFAGLKVCRYKNTYNIKKLLQELE